METLPAQDVMDGDFGEEEESSQETGAWGRLFPLGESFVAMGILIFVLHVHQVPLTLTVKKQ